MTGWLLLLLASTPVLEAEIDSQTREDDELPPSSVVDYTPRFEGRTLAGLVCGPEAKNGSARKLLQEGTRLTDSKDLAQVKRAVPKLQRALKLNPKAGWAYLILGSAHAKLGEPQAGLGLRDLSPFLPHVPQRQSGGPDPHRLLARHGREGRPHPSPLTGQIPAAREEARPSGCCFHATCPCDAGSRIL